METLIAALMIWIGSNTQYDVINIEPPEIQLLTLEEMTDEYYRGQEDLRAKAGAFVGVYALYNNEDSENGIIFLLDPRLNDELHRESFVIDAQPIDRRQPLDQEWLDHPVFQEQLLHELIHHVQYQSGAIDEFPCSAYAEKEAYLLGGKFLQLRHATDQLPNRTVLAYMYSRC